jgi:hypothetical protein
METTSRVAAVTTTSTTRKWRKNFMTFQFKVYYEDDSRYGYGKKRHKFIRARNKAQAMEKFRRKYGINPIDAV